MSVSTDDTKVSVEKLGNNGVIEDFSIDALVALAATGQHLFLASIVQRPWSNYFVVRLEYEHFPPKTPANSQFNMYHVTWRGMMFSLAQVPRDSEALCRRLADECGLRLANGVPATFDEKGNIVHWPIIGVEGENPNVWTLEFKKDSPLYSASVHAEYQKERDALNKIFAAHGDPLLS